MIIITSSCVFIELLFPFSDGMTPLMCAVISCNDRDSDGEEVSANTIEELISQGAKVNAKSDCKGETALHLAARWVHAAAAKKLLEHGTNANAEDLSGRTPLHTAVGSDAIDVFRVSIVRKSNN